MKKKVFTETILIALLSIVLLFSITIYNQVLASDDTINPDDFDPGPVQIEQGVFTSRANKILGFIQIIGMVTAVVGLGIIGFKFIFGSIEEKAEYKKAAMPYVVGCFMLMATALIIEVIKSVATI